MAGMHYVTMSQRHRTCRLEIGYYQPADVWHSVMKSNEVMMPPRELSESEDVDIATIPFHLSFQQLVELYGANDAALATFISRFQTRAQSSGAGRQTCVLPRRCRAESGYRLRARRAAGTTRS